jgi:hypothetical protein
VVAGTADEPALARLLHPFGVSREGVVMADEPTDGGSFPQDRYKNPETALGGADAVEKTTYVTGKGTDPSGQRPPGEPSARVKAGSGQGATWAIIAFFIIAAVLVYLLGYGR